MSWVEDVAAMGILVVMVILILFCMAFITVGPLLMIWDLLTVSRHYPLPRRKS